MLISEEYKALLRRWHKERPGYQGRHGSKYVADIAQYLDDPDVKAVLDYGAGLQTLGKAVKAAGYKQEWVDYDPAHAHIENLPDRQFDLLVCTDVLEHVEPENLEAVLDSIKKRATKYIFLQIACTEAAAIMPDGRNAHILIRPKEWWIDKIASTFSDWEMVVPETRPYHLFVHLKTKTQTEEK